MSYLAEKHILPKNYLTMKRTIPHRRFLITPEKLWTRLEGMVNRITESEYNPFYHLGTISIFLLTVLVATGVYLSVMYRPGSDVAYQSVEKISSHWLGSFIRSLHKYASDGLLIMIFLHFLKMLFSDRYWGARWLAWTSGWLMLALTWIIGTMGFWLIWDGRAQWLTELMMANLGSASALTYVAPDLASKTFSNFVIILFLHIFIPIITFLAIYIHVLRLARARWWAPRWVMVQTVLALAVLAVLKPVASAAPANLSRALQDVPMNTLYLGFLPLLDQFGSWIVLGLAFFAFGSLFLLPWLAKNREHQPAKVVQPACTGCVLCANECPYDAIRMVNRNDESGYHRLAVINAAQCTACGICVGACPANAISLADFKASDILHTLQTAVQAQSTNENAVAVVFVPRRTISMDGLPAPLQNAMRGKDVGVADWQGLGKVVLVAVSSIGAVNLDWLKWLNQAGVQATILLGTPLDDDHYREDSYWIAERLRLHKAMLTPHLHWVSATPTDGQPLANVLSTCLQKTTPNRVPQLPVTKGRTKLQPKVAGALAGLGLLFAVFALGLFVDVPASRQSASLAAMRIAIDAKGVVEALDVPENYNLPPGADAAQIFGGKHYPIVLQVLLNNTLMYEHTIQPSGISKNGRITALEYLSFEPDEYQVQILLQNDNQSFQTVLNETIEFRAGEVVLLRYDEENNHISQQK
jgi:quinol-cytochrome oxidoreductase complex cytochrome b subunit